MLPDTIQKRWNALPEVSKAGKKVNGLFRLLIEPELWTKAYTRIYSKDGANTEGIGRTSQDGFSDGRVANAIELLREGRYTFTPAKRVYIPKPSGWRPLGIPEATDKLVQEVCRAILEQIYEPIFSNDSHGFRPGRSCHTALEEVRRWDGFAWLVEMDIKGFYDNMDHSILINLLEDKIDDKRFLQVIKNMLKAGHVEDWKFHKSFSGVPQGSGVSPILSNIYLHELDKYMQEMEGKFTKGKKRQDNPEYFTRSKQVRQRERKEASHRDQGILPGFKKVRLEPIKDRRKQLSKIPSGLQMDSNFRRLRYCRYADDFLIGIIGSRQDANEVYVKVERFIKERLNLQTAPEKSQVSNSKAGTTFLGHNVRMYTGNKTTRTGNATAVARRTVVKRMQLHVPRERMVKVFQEGKFGDYEHGKSSCNPRWLQRSDLEILMAYNAVMRGFCNYYCMIAQPWKELSKFVWLMRRSFLRTLADKHKSSESKIARSLKVGKGDIGIRVDTAKGKKTYKLYSLKDLNRKTKDTKVDMPINVGKFFAGTELEKRLSANRCEYCGKEGGYFEVHHVRKLKDVQKGKTPWQKQMAEMRRKTLILCIHCHKELHHGNLKDWRRIARKRVESPVR